MTRDVDWRECEYCGDEFRGKGGLKVHQASAHDEKTTAVVRCNWCGSEVEVRTWETDEHHYCSRECGKAWNAYLRRGEKHPNYVDGTTRGRDFDWVAWAIRSRDENCARCGRPDGADHERALHVHHIVPEEETDDPHNPQNLLAVCGGCHQKLEVMSPEDQLSECDIDSHEELQLSDEIAEWLSDVREQFKIFSAAPEPWPGMFAEAQKHLDESDDS